MQITLDIPDLLIPQLTDTPDTLPRRILEVFALSTYQRGAIGVEEVEQLLNFKSRQETTHFLHQALLSDEDFNPEDFAISFRQALNGETFPISELWEKMDDE